MKQPNVLVRVAAVVSSLALVCLFIGCHAGAFDWLKPSAAGQSGNASPDSTGPGGGDRPSPVIFSGTKSASPSTLVVGATAKNSFTPDVEVPLFNDWKTPYAESNSTPNKPPATTKSAPAFVTPLPQWAVPNSTTPGDPEQRQK